MLKAIISFISQNWLSTTVSVVAILYAVYEARRRRGPLIAYQFVGQRIIGTKRDQLPQDVQILFQGKPVTNLSKTQIILWNKGDAPVKGSDISAHDPIGFNFGVESNILLSEITKMTRHANLTEIKSSGNNAIFSFEFLDKRDGALISIWHDGADAMPDCTGTIVGQKSGPVSYGRFMPPRRPNSSMRPSKRLETFVISVNNAQRKISYYLPVVLILIGIASIIVPFFAQAELHSLNSRQFLDLNNMYISILLGILYLSIGIWFLQGTRPRFPRSLMPDEFLAPSRRKKEEEGTPSES